MERIAGVKCTEIFSFDRLSYIIISCGQAFDHVSGRRHIRIYHFADASVCSIDMLAAHVVPLDSISFCILDRELDGFIHCLQFFRCPVKIRRKIQCLDQLQGTGFSIIIDKRDLSLVVVIISRISDDSCLDAIFLVISISICCCRYKYIVLC